MWTINLLRALVLFPLQTLLIKVDFAFYGAEHLITDIALTP